MFVPKEQIISCFKETTMFVPLEQIISCLSRLINKNDFVFILIISLKIKMLIGLCGNEGSGKTTIANLLTGKTINEEIISINPKEYVLKKLVFCKEEDILFLMRKFVDTEWDWSWCKTTIEKFQKSPSEWKALSFADPLKKVCSILFN